MSIFGSLFSGHSARVGAIQNALRAQKIADDQNALIREGQGKAIGALDAGLPLQLSSLADGRTAAMGDLDTATARFAPYVEAGQRAHGLYQDSLGLNGADGYGRATAAFHEGPGYRYRVDQATDAVARKASALGALGSGNTMAAISDRAGHEADQEFGGWQDRLNGESRLGYDATGQQAGLDRARAGIDYGYGQDRSSVYGNDATRRVGVYGQGTALGMQSLSNLGSSLIDANNAGVKAGQGAAANALGFGMNLANLGANLFKSAASAGMF